MNRADYRRVAQIRLADVQALMRAKRYDGTYYLAGYVVECALKACIARKFRGGNIPDRGAVEQIYKSGHDLRALARLADLDRSMEAEAKSDPQFAAHWLTVREWSYERRYRFGCRPLEAQNMVDGVADAEHGVLRWLKQHW